MINNQSDRAIIWYRCDPAEDLLSELRLGFSLAERCLHREGRDLCILRGSLPSDHVLLQKLFACTPDEFTSGWTERVAAEFPPDPANPGRLVNHWACLKVREAVEYRARQAANGAKGGRRRTRQAEPTGSDPQAALKPLAEPTRSDPQAALKPLAKLTENDPQALQTDSTDVQTYRPTREADSINKPVEHFPQFEPGESDLTEFFERQYARHPRKGDRNIALRYLEDALRSVSPAEFEAAHIATCESSAEFTRNGGQTGRKLSDWIRDQGWKDVLSEDPCSAKSLAKELQR